MQVRHFAAHYAGDEGLARPFSAMPSDRNLAWGGQPSSLPSPNRSSARQRPEHLSRDQPPATSAGIRQVCLFAACISAWQYCLFVMQRGHVHAVRGGADISLKPH